MDNTFTEFTGAGNLPFVRIANQAAVAEICLMGGHITSYVPQNQQELFFISEKSNFKAGMPIRGGVPLCWPWFGAPAPELQCDQILHGFARQSMWSIAKTTPISDEESAIVLVLKSTPESMQLWAHSFYLELEVVVGKKLQIRLATTNTGNTTFTYSQALHHYFNIGDIHQLRVVGFDGLSFFDKAPMATPPVENPQVGDITFRCETDRIYHHHTADAVIVDPVLQRQIRISKANSDTSVVWNPWIAKAQRMADFGDEEYLRMVCVESGNVTYDSRTLAPGEKHTLEATIAIEPLCHD